MTSIRLPAAPAAGLFAGLIAAAGLGLGAGALTAYLQGVLPEDWNTVANSGAVWTVAAFVAAAVPARGRLVAALVGLLVLTGEVAGYYVYLGEVRHLAGTHAAELLWTTAALWLGPLTGVAAFHARWGTAAQRMLGLVALAGVLVGEGCYLVRVAGVPRAGRVELMMGALLAVAVITRARVAPLVRTGALAAGVGVAAAVFVAYRLLALG